MLSTSASGHGQAGDFRPRFSRMLRTELQNRFQIRVCKARSRKKCGISLISLVKRTLSSPVERCNFSGVRWKCKVARCKVQRAKWQGARCKVQSAKLQGARCKVQSAKCKVARCKVQSAKRKVQSCKVQSAKCKVQRCKVQSATCKMHSVGMWIQLYGFDHCYYYYYYYYYYCVHTDGGRSNYTTCKQC